MPKSLSMAPLLALLALAVISLAPAAHAASTTTWTSSGWVSSATIYDLTGNSNLQPNSPLLAGHSYNLTLQVSVPNTSTSTKTFQVSLNTFVQPAEGKSVFWVVHNPSYPGYDESNFVGGDKTVTLNYYQGTVSLSAYFSIPANFTNPSAIFVTPSGNVTESIHLPQDGVILVAVVPTLSTGTGSFSASVEDQTIQTYQNAYNQTAALVPSGKIPTTYSSLVNSLLQEAQSLDKIGYPDQGYNLLQTIVPSAFPTPPSNALQTDLLGGLIGAVIVIVILAVLAVRSRGKSGYSTVIINDVQKDLAVLEVTAAKYDKAMADKLKALRDKLSESS